MSIQKIDCFKCKYFYVTWDRNHPKGCRAFQFKTRQMPSLEVSGHLAIPVCVLKRKTDKLYMTGFLKRMHK
ncbi:uracil-DNA glycosylase [Sporosarcina globispora]|uniref:uracil-DNA glycosylase n=1 Tax=Sporosarcina globispora TaxID=1459 RepID=UPI000A8E3944|nr:uracil-DNA glycosylase [Sporosarcina globispora]